MIPSRPHQPPVWPRDQMLRTGVLVGIVLLVAGAMLFGFLTVGMRERKIDRLNERAVGHLLQTRAALADYFIQEGELPSPQGNALPPEFEDFFAQRAGGKPFHEAQSRYTRRDFYSAGRPYSDPLVYIVRGDRFVLLSRGTDQDLDVDLELLEDAEWDRVMEALEAVTYDPVNGIDSSGDIWVDGGPDSF